MFFCENCKVKNGWPGVIKMSRGPCEVCKVVSDCYDVPSSYLPVPKDKEGNPNNEAL